jgi:IclR family acetate operon transcriptional repressor
VTVIEAVVDAGEPVGPRGLARVTGIDRSAVSRILQQLAELSVLDRHPEGYVPGPRLFTLARVLGAQDTLPNAVRPILEGLVEKFDETCYVCTLLGNSAVFLYEVQSSHPLRLVVELGKAVPIHAGAAGRAILSGMPAEEARRILGKGPLPAITPNTIRSVRRLLEQAVEDGRRGYSYSREERVEGGTSVAAPFFDHSGHCQGSVVFTAPLTRFDPTRVEAVGRQVAAAAAELSERLGYTTPELSP